MDVKDSISVTLKTIDGKETKDQSAKNIFSYKPIMNIETAPWKKL